MRPVIFTCLLGLLAACTAPFHSVDGALRASDVRTVAVEDDFTLYTPYDVKRSAELAKMVRINLRAVAGQLEMTFDEIVQIHAQPLEIQGFKMGLDGSQVHVTGNLRPPTLHDVAGFTAIESTGDLPVVVFFVAKDREAIREDGSAFTETFGFSYDSIVRHELAHQCSIRQGIDGEVWFNEGLALEMENATPDGDGLVPIPWPPSLAQAAKVHRETSLARVLDWREDGAAIAAGREEPFRDGRPLAHAYVRFLLEREGGERSPAAFRQILGMSREQHLALEDDWHRWLDANSHAVPGTV
jgi:hypothetical protein